MASWDFRPVLDLRRDELLYLQIAHALMADIHRGRLRPGDALPGYRSLAESLEVNRNTVSAAYQELIEEGWIVSRPAKGSFVAPKPPANLPFPAPALADKGAGEAMGFDLAVPGRERPPSAEGSLPLGTGAPDPRLMPTAALARALRRATLNERKAGSEDPQGHPRFRKALAGLLALRRGLPMDPERLLVTRGSQMGLYLVAQALLQPGDTVAVEALGSPRAWEALAQREVRLLPIPVDAQGLQVEALEAALADGPIKALLVSPACQYPTTVPLAPERRERLLALAKEHRFAVLEHDYDADFHYGEPLPFPLAASDPAGVVVYLGTLSKLFSPGLRLGLVHGPKPFIQRLRDLREVVDRHGGGPLELAMAELIEDGELQRHANRLQLAYEGRRAALLAALARHFGEGLRVQPSSGGTALWAESELGVDVDAWSHRARQAGLGFQPGRNFTLDDANPPALRIGFTAHPEEELEAAVKAMAKALS